MEPLESRTEKRKEEEKNHGREWKGRRVIDAASGTHTHKTKKPWTNILEAAVKNGKVGLEWNIGCVTGKQHFESCVIHQIRKACQLGCGFSKMGCQLGLKISILRTKIIGGVIFFLYNFQTWHYHHYLFSKRKTRHYLFTIPRKENVQPVYFGYLLWENNIIIISYKIINLYL